MIRDEAERWRLRSTAETLEVPITPGDIQRLRAYLDRMNRAEARYPHPPAPLDPDDPDNIVGALLECMEEGLSADEAENGLYALPWGDMVSWEQYNEALSRGDDL